MSTTTDATVGPGVEHWAYRTPSPFRDPAEIRELSSGQARPDLPAWGEDEFDVEAEFEAYDELDPTTEADAFEDGFFEEDYLAADLLAEAEGSDHPLASVFSLPRLAFDAMAKGGWATAIAIAVGTGQRDLNKLTNMVFWFRHPQLIGQKLRSDQVDLAREWVQIRDTIVRPALAGRTPSPAPAPAAPAYTPIDTTVGKRTMIPPDGLRWYGPPGEETPELMAFMRKVYLAHVRRSDKPGNRFVDTLPSTALDKVPSGQKARKDAAAEAREMFRAAQAQLVAENLQGRVRIGVRSGYRSADEQFGIWQGKFKGGKGGFPQYYADTRAARRRLAGGEFGDEAAKMLAGHIGGNVAAPGFSNHQDGLALDLSTRKGTGTLIKLYYGSWFHDWLKANARTYHFHQPLPNEPWHWVYQPPQTSGEAEWSEAETWAHEVVPTAVPAGKMKVPQLRVLAGHRGKGNGPDAILHWNAMPSVPTEIDVVVHLHGFSSAGKTLVNHYQTWAGLDLAPVDGAAGAGRTRPTLTVLPRGNNTGIKTRKGNLFKYTFPALTTKNGLDELLRESLQQFADRVGGLPPKVGRLILTAHSGGGAPLMRILRQRSDDISEIHVFDGLYQDATALEEWAARHIRADRKAVEAGGVPSGAMRVFYGPSTKANSLRLHDAIARALRGAPGSVTARYRVESSTLGHMQIPRQYGWRMLSDPAADVPDAAPPPARGPRVRREDELDTSESPLPAETWSESDEWEDEWEDEGEDEWEDEWEDEGPDVGEDEWEDEGENEGDDAGEDEGDGELQAWELEEPETWGEDLSDEMLDEDEDEDSAGELDEDEYLAGELDEEGPNDEATRTSASPRASIPTSWGGFGAELRQNKAMSEGEGAARAIALLKKSPTFHSIARRVGAKYRSRTKDLDAWLRVSSGHKGKRFLEIVGSPGDGGSFNPDESPFTDEIRIAVVNDADRPRVHTQQLAHEISHAWRFLSRRTTRPSDLWGAIQAAIDTEEVQARLVERKILSEIRRADRRAPRFPTTSVDPKRIEREISGMMLTYLESAVLDFKLHNAATAEQLSVLEQKNSRDEVGHAFPAPPTGRSQYRRTWFNILKAQEDWQKFHKRFSPEMQNYILERDRLANQHVRTILDREVMYRS